MFNMIELGVIQLVRLKYSVGTFWKDLTVTVKLSVSPFYFSVFVKSLNRAQNQNKSISSQIVKKLKIILAHLVRRFTENTHIASFSESWLSYFPFNFLDFSHFFVKNYFFDIFSSS